MDYIPLHIDGGVGDLIINLPWLRAFKNKTSPHPIRFYTAFPDILKYFWKFLEDDIREISDFTLDAEKNLYWIELSDVVKFRIRQDTSIPQCLASMYERWKTKLDLWGPLLEKHPLHGLLIGKQAIGEGLNRRTLPCHLVGLPYDPIKDLEVMPIGEKFITIHNGFDATGWHRAERSTKSWSQDYWKRFVFGFKERFPTVQVIQLGAGVNAVPIPEVDLNLIDKTSFPVTLRYLKSSLCHVDGDSGLVHARHLFEKPSVVIWGPTDPRYFSYEENVNLEPLECGNCWWMKADWLENCVAGFGKPICMDSITPEMVLAAVVTQLKGAALFGQNTCPVTNPSENESTG